MKKKNKTKLLFGFLLLLIGVIITSCTITILEVHQPEIAYVNSKLISTIRADFPQGIGSASYTLSILMPEDWSIQNNQVAYNFDNAEGTFYFTYNANNVSTITNAQETPPGYVWWSGVSDIHAPNLDKAEANVVFNTGSIATDYTLRYHIGDSQDNNLSEYQSGPKEISLINQPENDTLTDGRVFPAVDTNPWDKHTFEVIYFSANGDSPTSAELYLDEVAYQLNFLAGSASNGKYAVDIDFISGGQHDYYYLFDNSLRYPEGNGNLSITINDVDVYSLPHTESFEIASPSLSNWQLEGDWQVGQAMGLNGHPETAYEGDYVVGTILSGNGLTTVNSTNSILVSPIYDAREEASVSLNYYHNSQINEYSSLTVRIEHIQTGLTIDKEIISDLYTNGWEQKSINISDEVAGKLFRVILQFATGDQACPGIAIDNFSINVSDFFDADMKFVESTIVADKGDTEAFMFSLKNTGSSSDIYDLEISPAPEFSYQLLQNTGDDTWTNINFNDIELAPSQEISLKLQVEVPLQSQLDEEEIILNLTSDNGIMQSQNLTTKVRPNVLTSQEYGYVMYSSDYSDLAQYDWIPTTTANLLSEGDFLSRTMLSLGFYFDYFDSVYDSIYLTPYGGVSFYNYDDYSNVEEIPGNDGVDLLIGLYFTELGLTYGGNGYYEQTVIENQNAFILTFEDCYTLENRFDSFSAQMIIFENGDIKFQYASLPEEYELGYPLVGIENYLGNDGIKFQANYNALKENYALLFSRNLVAINPQPENYFPALASTDLSWENVGDFLSMKVYLKENDNQFSEADLIYNGNPTSSISNSQIPAMTINNNYYWKVVGITQEAYELSSPIYQFTVAGTSQASGYVTDSYTALPIEGVLVSVMNIEGGGEFRNSQASTLTDANGYWEMDLMSNAYYLEFTKDGYTSITGVYLNLYDDNSIDVEMDRLFALNPSPANDSFDININTSLSWQNPAGYNYAIVEISEDESMENASLVYEGPLTNYLSSISNLQAGRYYYWRVNLSLNGNENVALGQVWRFRTQFPESIPVADYEVEYPNYYMEKATRVASGYLIPGGESGNREKLMKVDNEGQVEWQHHYAMTNSVFKKAISLANGNYLIIRNQDTGYLYGEETGLSEVNSQGAIVWNQSYKYYINSSYSNEDVDDGIIDSAGNIVVCGSTGFGNWDFLLTKAAYNANSPMWQRRYGLEESQEKCNSLFEATGGGYVLTGYRAGTETSTIGNSRVLVMKVDNQGNQIWEYEEGFGHSGDGYSSEAFKSIELSDGSILVAGLLFDETSNFQFNQSLLIKISPQGQKLWHKTYPIKQFGRALDLAVDNDDNIYLTGAPDAMKVDSEGNILWIYEDDNDNMGSYFSSVFVTEAGFTIAGGGRIAIFGDNSTGPLQTPDNLNVTISGEQVELTWDSVSGATYYEIQSATQPNGNYSLESNSSTNSWQGTITGNRKFFKIKAMN